MKYALIFALLFVGELTSASAQITCPQQVESFGPTIPGATATRKPNIGPERTLVVKEVEADRIITDDVGSLDNQPERRVFDKNWGTMQVGSRTYEEKGPDGKYRPSAVRQVLFPAKVGTSWKQEMRSCTGERCFNFTWQGRVDAIEPVTIGGMEICAIKVRLQNDQAGFGDFWFAIDGSVPWFIKARTTKLPVDTAEVTSWSKPASR